MAFIKLADGTRVSVDGIAAYGMVAGTETTYIVMRGFDKRSFDPTETPEEIDALIAAAEAEAVRRYHATVDALIAEDEARRDGEKLWPEDGNDA